MQVNWKGMWTQIRVPLLVVVVIFGFLFAAKMMGTVPREISAQQYEEVQQTIKEYPQLAPIVQKAMMEKGKIDSNDYSQIMDEKRAMKRKTLGEWLFGKHTRNEKE
jgi:hypothetical protein